MFVQTDKYRAYAFCAQVAIIRQTFDYAVKNARVSARHTHIETGDICRTIFQQDLWDKAIIYPAISQYQQCWIMRFYVM